MIPPSEILCPTCGALFTDVCYGSEKRSTRLRLMRAGKGSAAHFALEPLKRKDENGEDVVDVASYALEDDSLKTGDPIPNVISVRINGGQPEQFRRCCPHCQRLTLLPAAWGSVPSFVVVTLGFPGEGKSSLLQALNVVENMLSLSYSRKDVVLKVPGLVDGERLTSRATAVDSLGNSVVVTVCDEAEKPLANVLFRDVAGEIFRSRDLKSYQVYNFFRAHGSYPGPDGFFLVHAATQPDALLTRVYDYINALLLDLGQAWPPTACVITHLDQITGNDVWVSGSNMGKRVTVLDEKTFPCCNAKWLQERYYSTDRLIPRLILQDSLVRGRYGLLSTHFRALPNARCFLVKSCSGQGLQADYFQPINVLDPFLWMLNELGLVAIT